jgi:hypothetical protein
MIVGGSKLRVLMWSALIPAYGSAQCPSPEAVLQRYVDAVGGKVVYDIQSRVMTVRELEGDKRERYVYKFKWKAPNKVTAGFVPYLLNVIPVSYPNGTFLFDGEEWSDVFGRTSRNEERDPSWQRALRHKYPYNENPNFLMFRVVADPLMMTRANELYSSFEIDNSADHPGLCVLRANGIDEWQYKRQDILTFDAATGFLRTWKIQAGIPPHKTYVQFQFEDYRRVGAVKFPFTVSFDFYKAKFRYTQVVDNKALPDSDFVSKPAKP